MIDTDKYTGHTPAPWWIPSMELRGSSHPVVKIATFKTEPSLANRLLITDAPLLLAEVKRLNRFVHCAMNFMSKHELDSQFLNEHGVFSDGNNIAMYIPYSYKWDDETKVSSEPIEFTVRGDEE